MPVDQVRDRVPAVDGRQRRVRGVGAGRVTGAAAPGDQPGGAAGPLQQPHEALPVLLGGARRSATPRRFTRVSLSRSSVAHFTLPVGHPASRVAARDPPFTL